MSSRPDDSGFTIFEAALALALLSILGSLVATFARGGLRAIEGARSAAVSASTLLRAETAIREAASRVRIPYWDRGSSLGRIDGGVSIPYYDGDPASRLELSREGRSLRITEGGESRRFAPVEELGIEPLRASTGELRGIEVELAIGGSRCGVAARFGQAPLGPGVE